MQASVFYLPGIKYLRNFPRQSAQLAIVERAPQAGAETFFEKLKHVPLEIIGQVSKVNSLENIHDMLSESIPDFLLEDAFYRLWISDMSQISEMFCDINDSDAIGFCLSSQRVCARYHVDNVPMRLLVTYAGQGTEWIPDNSADRRAFESGAPNEEIVKDPSNRQFIKPWNISLFRGGPRGLLHRTPDSALKNPTVLLRLDNKFFWNKVTQDSLKIA
jgi:hypothetical protein